MHRIYMVLAIPAHPCITCKLTVFLLYVCVPVPVLLSPRTVTTTTAMTVGFTQRARSG